MSTAEAKRRALQRKASLEHPDYFSRHNPDPVPLHRILRLQQVEEATGLPRSSIYDLIYAGAFPKPIPLGPRTVGWLSDEVAAWQQARIAARDLKIAS